MNAFFDKFKGMMGAGDAMQDDYDDEYDQGEEEQQEYEQPSITPQVSPIADEKKKERSIMSDAAVMQVVLVKPERFEDASAIADHLNQKKTVVLNLEGTSKELARRLVDFLTGVAYANAGLMKRVASSTFIITPYNVDIMGDLLDELESNGVYF